MRHSHCVSNQRSYVERLANLLIYELKKKVKTRSGSRRDPEKSTWDMKIVRTCRAKIETNLILSRLIT
jgi:hypothetical protein